MWQTYYTPTSVPEAVRLLSENAPDARVIAGGTDLMIELRQGQRQTDVLIDITRIGGLDQIQLDDAGIIHVGPAVSHSVALSNRLLVERAFPLVLACWHIGTPQLRNRGTIAGNLLTASPSNDTIPALQVMGAEITLQSVRGERTVPLSTFYQGVRETAIAPDELLTDIAFPALAPNQRGTFSKIGLRRTQAISVASTAVLLTLEDNDIVEAKIALGSVAATVIRAREAEAALVGGQLTDNFIDRAADMASRAASPINDIRATATYRQDVVSVLVQRALLSLRDGSERDRFPDEPPRLWSTSSGHFPRLVGKTIHHTSGGFEPIEFTVNGENFVVQHAGGKTLLQVLRDDLKLTGAKEGCGEGECGACTVWMDKIAVLSCITPAPRAHGTEIVTIEGIAKGEQLHPLQQAFLDQGAVQCGYCTPGFIMAGVALLDEIPQPSREQILAGLSGNLCRCTGYSKIVAALEQAANQSNDQA